MPQHGDLTAAGVGETLDGFLGKFTHPDVRQNAASYTAIMKDAGFGSLEILLQYDDVELNEMHDQLIKDGIPRGHSMEIRKQIKLCLLYTSPSPRDRTRSRMPSSA